MGCAPRLQRAHLRLEGYSRLIREPHERQNDARAVEEAADQFDEQRRVRWEEERQGVSREHGDRAADGQQDRGAQEDVKLHRANDLADADADEPKDVEHASDGAARERAIPVDQRSRRQ